VELPIGCSVIDNIQQKRYEITGISQDKPIEEQMTHVLDQALESADNQAQGKGEAKVDGK
jgi:hypothetical protein